MATCCCCQCIYISSCGIVCITIPDIWKLIGTNCCIGCISDQRVDGQIQHSDRIATCCCGDGIYISSCSIIYITVPGIWKLIGTNCCIGCISDQRIDGQVQYSNCITTCCCCQCINISSCSIVCITVPGIWKLIGTNCCIGCISDQLIDGKVQHSCCVPFIARSECVNISSCSIVCITVPDIWKLVSTNSCISSIS